MPKYHTPGVYFEWQDRRFDALSLARADVTGFVGIAVRGQVGTPVRVESWNQFTSLFGPHTPAGFLAFAVEGFFNNGGRRCWIVRVASNAAAAASWTLRNSQGNPAVSLVAASPGSWARDLQITTIPLGSGLFTLVFRLPDGTRETWRNLDIQRPYADILLDASQSIRLTLTSADLWQSPPPLVVQSRGASAFAVTVANNSMTVAVERTEAGGVKTQVTGGVQILTAQLVTAGAPASAAHDAARMQAAVDTSLKLLQFVTPERFAGTILNDGASGSVLARVVDITDVPDPRARVTQPSAPGKDGLSDLSGQQFQDGLDQLARIDEIAVLAMPDIYEKPPIVFKKGPVPAILCTDPSPGRTAPPPPQPVEMPAPLSPDAISALQQSMVAQCVQLKDRMAVLDPPLPEGGRIQAKQWRDSFQTPFAACYYPWVRVPDPLANPGALRTIPPCGHIAGVFGRVEKLVGVHKPPANEILQGVEDVSMEVDDIIHGLLNDEDVNVIRPTRGRQVRVLGARTTSETDDWRYVNVRRLFIALERSIRVQLQWTVFEPGNPALWARIDRVVRSFLDGLWQRGFLDGDSREAAYTVTCDATTNPPSETDNGRVICEIGALPPWPAEFVVVRIGITEGEVEMLSPAEAQIA